jgi:hypothetical protein
MKRANIEISAESLIELLNLPEDFKFSGIEYSPDTNKISIFGYSGAFPDVLELNIPSPNYIHSHDQKWLSVEKLTLRDSPVCAECGGKEDYAGQHIHNSQSSNSKYKY